MPVTKRNSMSLKNDHGESSNIDEDSEMVSLRRRETDDLGVDQNNPTATRHSSRTHAIASVKAITHALTSKSAKSITSRTKVPSQMLRKSPSMGSSNAVQKSQSSSSGSSRQRSLKGNKKQHSVVRKSVSQESRVRKQNSVQSSPPLKKCVKELWFMKGAIVAVRADPNAMELHQKFHLCRLLRNVYNTTKEVPIRWFSYRWKSSAQRFNEPNMYTTSYKDNIDPACILLEVAISKCSKTVISLQNMEEVDKMVDFSEGVEVGDISVDDVEDDVEEVVQIEEPPKKKPRLTKTASQKLAAKAKKTLMKKSKSTTGKTKSRPKKAKKEKAIDGQVKRKKATKEDELKLNPRPGIKVLELDPLFQTRSSMPYVSKTSNSRLIFRAIYLKDKKLLKKLLSDGSQICYLYSRSIDNEETPLIAAAKSKDDEIFRIMLMELQGEKFKNRLEDNDRDRSNLSRLGTGMYNKRSLGVNYIRPITASRGSREGNNALTKEEHEVDKDEDSYQGLYKKGLDAHSQEVLEKFLQKGHYRKWDDDDVSYFEQLILNGDNVTAGKYSKELMKSTYGGKIVTELLTYTKEELKNCPPSAVKQVFKKVYRMTPFHFASINPNPKYLKKLISVQPDVNVIDRRGRKPIHLAACCSNPANLEVLLGCGANPNDTDSYRQLPLHYAVSAKKAKNVDVLLKSSKSNPSPDMFEEKFGAGGVNRPNYDSLTPLHLAVKLQSVDTAAVLLSHGASVNAKLSVSKYQVSPLMMAAASGNLEMVKLLVKHGAVVEQKDRLGRRAVIHACMNGATSVLSYLLNIGASATRPDSSDNTPVHYAAAYGWYFTLKLLLLAEADPNVANMWKVSPVSIAFMKSHVGIVHELLNSDKVDVNFVDGLGASLLFHACASDLDEADLFSQIQYMVEKKGANCDMKDITGKTPLHYLAQATVSDVNKSQQAFKQSIKIAELLLKNGCELNAVDDDGFTATMLVLGKFSNISLAESLFKNGGQILPPTDGERKMNMLHMVGDKLWEGNENPVEVLKFFKKHGLTKVGKAMAGQVCRRGLTPMLSALLANRFGQTFPTDDDEKNITLLKQKWENIREFIHLLIKDFDSDVNAKLEKQVFEIDEMPKEHSTEWYFDEELADSCAALIALDAFDPEINDSGEMMKKNAGIILGKIIKGGANLNAKNANGHTPLSTAVLESQEDVVALLIRGGCDPNQPALDNHDYEQNDDAEYHPFHVAARHADSVGVSMFLTLIEEGSDVNARVEDKRTFLHALLTSEELEKSDILKIVEKLSTSKYDFNCTDAKGRNVLHCSARRKIQKVDGNLALEVRLIRLGVNLGQQDDMKRTPLFYVFKQNCPEYCNDEDEDPAELVKILCKSMTKKEINYRDIHGRTALHYAAKKGATMCCMYLMMVGADIFVKDNDGNSAINLAVMNSHDSCATALLHGGSSLRDPVVNLSHDEKQRRKALKCKEKLNKASPGSVEPSHTWEWTLLEKVCKEPAISSCPIYQAAIKESLNGVSMFIADADESKSGMNDFNAITMSMSCCRYNTSNNLICTTTNTEMLRGIGEDGRNLLHMLALSCEHTNDPEDETIVTIAETLIDRKVPVNAPDKWNVTPLQYAILNQSFALADFLADKAGGYNVKYKDGFNRSHLAAACWRVHSKGIKENVLSFIEKLLDLKANPDEFFDLPLDPVLARDCFQGEKQDPNYWQKHSGAQTTCLITAILCTDFKSGVSGSLLKKGAKPNIASNKITPLMHAVIKNNVHNVKQLLNYDYDPKAKKKNEKKKSKNNNKQRLFRLKPKDSDHSDEDDGAGDSDDEDDNSDCNDDDNNSNSDSEDEISESEKDTKSDQEFESIEKTSPVNLNAKDQNKWTALHYVLHPHEFGTYDNNEIAFVLTSAGAVMSNDASGQTPLDFAVKKWAPKVENLLRSHFNFTSHRQSSPDKEMFKVDDKVKWQDSKIPDFTAAAEKLLKRHDSGMEVEDVFVHEIDGNCNAKANGGLVKDEELNEYFDVLLTKVDVNKDYWGMYNFYQIQLVHQPSNSLYILFTRWGRISDDGQFQHTPFSDKESAEKEFKKIFREKTGNKWTDLKNFERKPKKYRLVEEIARKAPPALKDVDINLETKVKSILPKHLYKVIETWMSPQKMRLSMTENCYMDPAFLPFGQLNRDRLLQGKQILEEIDDLVMEKSKYEAAKKDGENDPEQDLEHQRVVEKISELSNDYFHVIPQKDFSCEKIRPLGESNEVKIQIHTVKNLLDYEVAGKMLFGAMANKESINCVDYIYKCLDCQLELMNEHDIMSQMILQHIYCDSNRTKVQAIYKVCRAEEEERLQWAGLGNHALLWHGTSNCNMLSILRKGLIVAPLDSSCFAWKYGKGIYFSDDFSHSSYFVQNKEGEAGFMFLCEIALGTVKTYSDQETMDRLQNGEGGGEKVDDKCTKWDSRFFMGPENFENCDWYILPSGVKIPRGARTPTNDVSYGHKTEYVVTNPEQVRIRYLIQFKEE